MGWREQEWGGQEGGGHHCPVRGPWNEAVTLEMDEVDRTEVSLVPVPLCLEEATCVGHDWVFQTGWGVRREWES